jgi:hypothetical protein
MAQAGQVHSSLCDNNLMFREVKQGISVVQVHNGSNTEQPLGDVAREGLERNGSGRQPVSVTQPSICVDLRNWSECAYLELPRSTQPLLSSSST